MFYCFLYFLTNTKTKKMIKNLHPRRKLSSTNLFGFLHEYLYCVYCCPPGRIRCNDEFIVCQQGIKYIKKKQRKRRRHFPCLTFSFSIYSFGLFFPFKKNLWTFFSDYIYDAWWDPSEYSFSKNRCLVEKSIRERKRERVVMSTTQLRIEF